MALQHRATSYRHRPFHPHRPSDRRPPLCQDPRHSQGTPESHVYTLPSHTIPIHLHLLATYSRQDCDCEDQATGATLNLCYREPVKGRQGTAFPCKFTSSLSYSQSFDELQKAEPKHTD